MADAAADDVDKAEKGQKEVEQESPYKLCFFALLDIIATIGRTIVATASGIKWATQRCCYPMKEWILDRVDQWKRWYRPYSKKRPGGPNTPSFSFGMTSSARDVPGFQY
mmetsp:Transcript_73739/g.190271  ORF Transcript_73739/g.190271 Transcript_73739/m.190271 type:complete len:109 (-) Transcript_73739:93-419(-)